jgi:acyl-CoA synthetase (NDP forming)
MHHDLERFFNPRSIAVIGASQDLITISGQPLHHLVSHHYAGRLYPVNPKYQEILGVKCYASIEALPETPDLALILINSSRAAEMLRACGKKGVRFAIVFSSGYSEVGGRGIEMQRELAAVAAEFDMGIIGPNCQGMLNAADNVYAGFGSVFFTAYDAGAVSMVSQSGGFGFSVMNLASKDGGVHFRQMVTTGNEIGVSTLDFIEHFIDDAGTEVIAVYIEGLKDAHRLLEVGRHALAQKKPILAWKVGNSVQGARAAASHTANLGGAMALYQAAFRQSGIIQVEDIQDVVDYSRAFRCGKLPKGNRVAIITVSGGAGILMTDECVARGMQVPQLAAETTEKLRAIVPAFGSIQNPVDVTAAIFNDLSLIRRTLQAVLDDPNVDAIAMINASLQGELADNIAIEITAIAAQTDKPIFLAWSARDELARAAYARLDALKIPHYKSPVRCGRALAALSSYAASLRREERRLEETVPICFVPMLKKQLVVKRYAWSEHFAKQALADYGIGVTREILVSNAAAAVEAARTLGYPVVLKVQSPDIPHKTEARAVRLGVDSDTAVALAFDEIMRNAQAYQADARIEGVLVQEMVAGGIETILGVTNDPLFGPAVMFGLGGIFAEVLHDVSFRLAPVTYSVALEMIDEIKGSAVLKGARGAAPADIDALAGAIVRVSAMAIDLQDHLAELDINPLFVLPKGQGVKAGDALLKPKNSA